MLHFLCRRQASRRDRRDDYAHCHAATDVRDIGLRSATDDEIAAHARANGMTLISGDFDFADIVHYPPADHNGLIVIEPPKKATRAVILKLIEQFLNTPDVVSALTGRLVVVSAGRIRVRPPI